MERYESAFLWLRDAGAALNALLNVPDWELYNNN